MLEKHEPQANASRTYRVFLKIPKCLYNSTMYEEQVFGIACARTDDVGCVHYISCDVTRVHWCDVTARALWKYNELVLTNQGAHISH